MDCSDYSDISENRSDFCDIISAVKISRMQLRTV